MNMYFYTFVLVLVTVIDASPLPEAKPDPETYSEDTLRKVIQDAIHDVLEKRDSQKDEEDELSAIKSKDVNVNAGSEKGIPKIIEDELSETIGKNDERNDDTKESLSQLSDKDGFLANSLETIASEKSDNVEKEQAVKDENINQEMSLLDETQGEKKMEEADHLLQDPTNTVAIDNQDEKINEDDLAYNPSLYNSNDNQLEKKTDEDEDEDQDSKKPFKSTMRISYDMDVNDDNNKKEMADEIAQLIQRAISDVMTKEMNDDDDDHNADENDDDDDDDRQNYDTLSDRGPDVYGENRTDIAYGGPDVYEDNTLEDENDEKMNAVSDDLPRIINATPDNQTPTM